MSADDLEAVVASLRFSNYLSLAVPTAVAYDYLITFPQEINCIWLRPWSFVTLIFFTVRYLGVTVAVLNGLYGSTFIPGPLSVRNVLLFLDVSAFIIFLAASDIVMILRVYALWNKSKTVLGVLLVFYVSEVVLFSVSAAYYNNPNTNLMMSIGQVLDMSFCNPIYNTTNKLGAYKFIPRITLSALLLILAVSRLCMEAYQSYKTTRRFEVNQYIQLLVREGILYFLAHLLYLVDFGQTNAGVIMTAITTVVMFIVTPRFIMSVRNLYFSSCVHINGKQMGIDTGFGIGKSQGSEVSTVGFARSEGTSETAVEEVEMQDVSL